MVAAPTSAGSPASSTPPARDAGPQDGRTSTYASNGTSSTQRTSTSAATITVLSEAAAAFVGGGGGIGLSQDIDELVQSRTEALAKRLTSAFEASQIRTDEPLALRVDRYGTIEADGPQKKKIEKLMREDPELAREFRTVASLNAARAVAEALRLHAEELKAARNPGEKRAADDRYSGRAVAIHTASGSMTLTDGRLISAAVVYAQSLSDPPAEGKELAAWLADQKTDFLV
ncbi:hypothetical protein [Phreatobacter sp.]|uniref:hypothetical protein n=1 Tax=Phreatobacter sp. TaxID=1966341 RepID=UPI0025CC542D|nr:hypothetical protein [Phreatobacter sp.]